MQDMENLVSEKVFINRMLVLSNVSDGFEGKRKLIFDDTVLNQKGQLKT